jgi:hypothetical protein
MKFFALSLSAFLFSVSFAHAADCSGRAANIAVKHIATELDLPTSACVPEASGGDLIGQTARYSFNVVCGLQESPFDVFVDSKTCKEVGPEVGHD